MISLLGSILGFASGVVPEIVGYFRKKQDHQFELELYEAKAKYAIAMRENADLLKFHIYTTCFSSTCNNLFLLPYVCRSRGICYI